MLTYLTGLTYLKIGFANNRNVVVVFYPLNFLMAKKLLSMQSTLPYLKQNKVKQSKTK